MPLSNAEIQKRYRERHREERADYQRRVRAEGRGKDWSNKYYRTHKEEMLEYRSKPENVQRYREIQRRYDLKNALKRRDLVAYQKYLDEKIERLKIAVKVSADKRRRFTPEMKKINKAIRTSIDNCLRRQNSTRFLSTFELLGTSPKEFMDYIADKFQEGMSWDNWGEWELDHIRPSASFDLTRRSHQRMCFHYTNYQPLWQEDNRIKGAKWSP